MFTQFLGTVATAYGVLGALKTLLQTRQMLARRSSRDVSAGFLASYAGGYDAPASPATWACPEIARPGREPAPL
jgi:hypothetical protein